MPPLSKPASANTVVSDQTPTVDLTADQRDLFHQQGYLKVDNLLSSEHVAQIIERLDPLFETQFETGIYPDEWYGRPGLSQPNATRQMTGLWRCDRTLASFTLSPQIARLNAQLMDWSSARYGLDTCWIKPPGAPAVSFHRNNTYVAVIDPPSIVTCWIALTDVVAESSPLEIIPGSHQWHCSDQVRFLHAPRDNYRSPLWQAVSEAGISKPEILPVTLSSGSAIFLHGDLWHGSGPNQSATLTRRSLAISTLPGQSKFRPPGKGTGYIFDRYRRQGELAIHESYYPILWSQDGYRTPFLRDYCQDFV